MADQEEKKVNCKIPADATAGFCWDGKDVFSGDSVSLPESIAIHYSETGKVVIEAPKEKNGKG